MRTSCSELTSTVNVDSIDYKEKAEQLECMAQEQKQSVQSRSSCWLSFFSFQLDEFVSRASCHHSSEHVLLLIKKNINNKTMFLKRNSFWAPSSSQVGLVELWIFITITSFNWIPINAYTNSPLPLIALTEEAITCRPYLILFIVNACHHSSYFSLSVAP